MRRTAASWIAIELTPGCTDSFSGKKDEAKKIYESDNLMRLVRFVEANNLHVLFAPPRNKKWRAAGTVESRSSLLLMIQSLIAPSVLSFDTLQFSKEVFGFPDSQRVVYGNAIEQQMFGGFSGREVNMEWVLHSLNFWKYHLMREDEGTLYYAFNALDHSDRPRYWSQQLSNGAATLGQHWKGSYSFVDRDVIRRVRDNTNDAYFQDEFNGESEADAFQDLRLELVSRGEETWPFAFERHLHSLRRPVVKAKTRAQKRSAAAGAEETDDLRPVSFRFNGEGSDSYEDFRASGWLNPLPPPAWRGRLAPHDHDEVFRGGRHWLHGHRSPVGLRGRRAPRRPDHAGPLVVADRRRGPQHVLGPVHSLVRR